MNLRDRAIGGAAVVEFCIGQIERELAEGLALSKAAGLPTGKMVAARDGIARAHRLLEELRTELSQTVGSPNASRSGGSTNGKEPTPPGEEP